jgi:hypothetical protein
LQNEKEGARIWKDFTETLGERLGKFAALLEEGYVLCAKATQAYDAGIFEGSVILCRAALESTFLQFLTMYWRDEDSFNIVFPTTLDGKPRAVEFEELRNGIKQRVGFHEKQLDAVERIQQNANFVAHWASRRIKGHHKVSEEYKRWEAINKNATDSERMKAVNEIYQSIVYWITPGSALQDLRDTSSIMLRVAEALGKKAGSEIVG